MITIIGAGQAGRALGNAFIRVGKSVLFGVANIPKYRDLVQAMGKLADITSVDQALSASSDIIFLAVPYPAALDIAGSIPDWKNKILVDITTPWLPDLSGLAIGLTTSAAETIARTAHHARVVKAFNTMGAECFDNPSIVNGRVFLPVCSDDEQAKHEVMQLGKLIGMDAVDAGNLKNARTTEPMVALWLQLTFKLKLGRTFEFGLLSKNIK